jgi:N-sulfoglucosamine sulfohydrolase
MVSWADLTPTILDFAGAKAPDYPLHGRSFMPVLEQENPSGWDEVFISHTFHEITMYYPLRGIRTRRYKYIRNLFPELEFPFASDLFASETWQSVRRAGPSAALGKRPVKSYLHRPAEELYDLNADPDELNNLAASPQSRDLLQTMRARVQDFRTRTKDGWLINDDYR